MVHRYGWAFRINAGSGEHDVHLLASGETDRAGFGVFEGLAGAGDVVDPRLQAGIDVEVDEPGADDDGVGRQKLGNQLVGIVGGNRFFSRALVRCLADGRSLDGVEMRDWISRQIAVDERVRSRLGFQLARQFTGELVGNRLVATWAGSDEQNVGHGLFLAYAVNSRAPWEGGRARCPAFGPYMKNYCHQENCDNVEAIYR
ncbi:hypothetical protein AT6N2_C1127 [Agrobacterium tumefaciens]|nr:hypothetical protein AT6N2_C1127 [Agrobacterium tumefaciens]